jgi:hypothetical protein
LWPDAEATYRVANAALALAHVGLVCAFARLAWGRHPLRTATGGLGWPLVVFFASGVVTHALNAADAVPAAGTHLPAAFALRAAVVAALTLPLWFAQRAARGLPTKEQYARLLAEKDAALAEAGAAVTRATASAAREAGLRRVADAAAKQLGQTIGALREELEKARDRRTLDDDDTYHALRRGFHELSNTASTLPRTPTR